MTVDTTVDVTPEQTLQVVVTPAPVVNVEMASVPAPTTTVLTETNQVTVSLVAPPGISSVDAEVTQVAVQVVAGVIGPQGPVGEQGPVGDQGPVGVQGPGGVNIFTYTQDQPSAQWTINHNLGLYLPVVVLDTSGDFVEGDVVYVDPNTIVITFSAPFSGVAYVG
jgi:hypothetical protein